MKPHPGWIPLAVLLLLLVPTPPRAADGPRRGPDPAQVAPAAPWRFPLATHRESRGHSRNPLVRRTLPATATDKGSAVSDAAVPGTPGPLTDREQAKLEGARAAVMAARSGAGVPAPADPARVQAEKALRLRAATPARLSPGTGSGIGTDLPPVQRVGPQGLNAQERAKLERLATPASGTKTRKEGR
jgi:hypothetical protein